MNRREFLTTSAKGLTLIAAGTFAPAFLARTARAATPGKDANILVVVQLSGGNDGLNTVIPFSDDLYHKARPSLAIPGDAALKIDDHTALHSALSPLKSQFDDGHLSILQNVGYPNPNRSHFRAMEIWHTGATEDEKRQTLGWVGRYFDAQCEGMQPHDRPGSIGVTFGKTIPQAFRNEANVGLALENPDTFQWNASGETSALAREQKKIFERMNTPGGPAMFDSLAQLGGVDASEPAALDFLRHTALNAVQAGSDIRGILDKQKNLGNYPDTGLSRQLKMVARLISGDFPARVYYTSQGGFDTHANQPGTHANLLADFAGSVAAFQDDLKKHGQSGRVIVLAFSEFGRRVAENGSSGTDHGAAAPMFLAGDAVKGGIRGGHPDLANLLDGDLRHSIDFRQVYASVLEDWLHTSPQKVFGRSFEKVSVL